jgi:hypothetical protein
VCVRERERERERREAQVCPEAGMRLKLSKYDKYLYQYLLECRKNSLKTILIPVHRTSYISGQCINFFYL